MNHEDSYLGKKRTAERIQAGLCRKCPRPQAPGRTRCAKHIQEAREWSTPERSAWSGMKDRCHNPLSLGYARYGGRGITVCDEWRESFEAFLQHIGPRPSSAHSIDRIDNDRGYEPGNVRWATAKEQQRNRRCTRPITAFGRTQPLPAWAEEVGISPITLRGRIERGWDPEKALSQKPQKRTPRRRPKYESRAALAARVVELEAEVAVLRSLVEGLP